MIGELIDRAVGVVAPRAAIKRMAARRALGALNSAYRGAEGGRLRGGWLAGQGSADGDILPELATLRERSRDLIRNDGHAAGIMGTIAANVVGTGIRPQCMIDYRTLGISEQDADELKRIAERHWQDWAMSRAADAGDRHTFYALQRLFIAQQAENGDALALIRMKPRRWTPYQLALSLVEADRLESPAGTPLNSEIRGGVEVGRDGEPIAYHIRARHPGDYTIPAVAYQDKIERIVARDDAGRLRVLHGYDAKRAGQTRGVPWLTPVMSLFKDLMDYREAELVAARVGACFAMFIKKTDPYAAAIGASDAPDSQGRRIESLEPGIIERLGDGEEPFSFTPNRPNSAFDQFIERLLRTIAAAVDLPYELVAKDFSKVNYSSARAALLEARRRFRMEQQALSVTFCQPVWEWFLEELFVTGKWPVGDFYERRAEYVRCRWISPGWEWVDPQKEVNASVIALKNNLSTLADELGARGRDPEETIEQRASEQRRIRANGLVNQKEEAATDSAMIKLGVPLPIEDFYRRYGRRAPAQVPTGDDQGTLAQEPSVRYDDNNIYAYHIQMGCLTYNEVRAKLGFPPIEGGDRLVSAAPSAGEGDGPPAREDAGDEPDEEEQPEREQMDDEDRTDGES